MGVLAALCVYAASMAGGQTPRASAVPTAPEFLGTVWNTEIPILHRFGPYFLHESPETVAVDSSSGSVYLPLALHAGPSAVVKTSPYGAFVLIFGGRVNKTKIAEREKEETNKEAVTVTPEEEDLCTAASGDECVVEGKASADPLIEPGGVAVEQASGAVYVIDRRAQRVDKYSADGRFELTFGLEVNKAKTEAVAAKIANGETPTEAERREENRCLATETCQAGKAGSGDGAFQAWHTLFKGARRGHAIAVGGPNGRVYVGDRGRVQEFNAQGEWQQTVSLASSAEVVALAVATNGDLYVAQEGVAGVHVIEPDGTASSTSYDGASTGVDALALDGSGSLAVVEESPTFHALLYELANPAAPPAEFGAGEPGALGKTYGIAINGAGTIYAPTDARASESEPQQALQIFGAIARLTAAYGEPPLSAPRTRADAVEAGVEATSATLNVEINPEFRETTYQLEWGPQPCGTGTCAKVPASPAPIGFARTWHTAHVLLAGLRPGQLYHYRLIVTSSAGIAASAEDVFRIGLSTAFGSTGLPDGRIYEQVSPQNKYGNEVTPESPAFVAPNGERVMYTGSGALSATAANSGTSPLFVSERAKSGWVTRSAMPLPVPGRNSVEEYMTGFTSPHEIVPAEDLSRLLFGTSGAPFVGPPDEPKLPNNIYLEGANPLAEPIWVGRSLIEGSPGGAEALAGPKGIESTFRVAGASPNLKTVYFFYGKSLFPGASGLYEYRNGVLTDAGTLPHGERSAGIATAAAQPPVTGKKFAESKATEALGLTAPSALANQVSANGNTIFFTREDEQGTLELYAHLTAPTGSQSTVLVSQSQLLGHQGTPAAHGPVAMPSTTWMKKNGSIGPSGQEALATYVFASPDGSHAFFESVDRLTTTAPESALPKTYDFDLETGSLEYLPAVSGSIVTVAEGGAAMVFENTAIPGDYALERWAAGPGGGSVTQIAQLPGVAGNVCAPVLCVGPAYTSSNGEVTVFSTESPIAGFNDGGTHYALANPTENERRYEEEAGYAKALPNREIFRYDAHSNELSCISCPGKGVTPSSNAEMSLLNRVSNDRESTGELPEVNTSGRAMTASGSAVFFETREALVPQDVNGVNDVYEWENGKLYLISSGHSAESSFLMGTDESGSDVFFITAEGIAPGDTDGSYDVYDAHVLRPGEQAPPAAVPCKGAVCQGPPSVPQLLGAPASEAFSGPGNPLPPASGSVGRHHQGKAKPKKLTRRQKLRRAVRACRRSHRHDGKRWRRCVRKAHRRFAAKRSHGAKRRHRRRGPAKGAAAHRVRHHGHNGRGK